jgi:predicted Zn finger-like uncharacterized protein
MRIFCPQCKTELNVSDNLAGTRVRCGNAACQHTFSIPTTVKKAGGVRGSQSPLPGRSDHGTQATSQPDGSAKSSPAGPPPLSSFDRPSDFVNEGVERPARPRESDKGTQRLNLADMFLGKEKEHVFPLLPGEEVLDELTIQHHHLFIVQRGLTRVTLTTHRVLYTRTRVFSPVYWLLLVLFFPLIFYYAVRISRNRNVSMPLVSIDSADKRYRPNWLLLVVGVCVAYVVAGLCTFAVMSAFDEPEESMVFAWTIRSIVLGLIGPAVLALLLATRGVGIAVFSRNNGFAFQVDHSDLGVSEDRVDAFLQRMHAEMERAKTLSRVESHAQRA